MAHPENILREAHLYHQSDHGSLQISNPNSISIGATAPQKPMPETSTARNRTGLDIYQPFLVNYMHHFRGKSGSAEEYRQELDVFRRSCISEMLETGYADHEVNVWVKEQLQSLESLMEDFCSIASRFETLKGSNILTPNNLPLNDTIVRNELADALANGDNVFDMPNTAPFKHWQNDMTSDQLYSIAELFLRGLKKMHGGRGSTYVSSGYNFTARFNTVLEVLRKCKGSVYRMSRPTTLNDILSNPRKMRQRFIDNQINNAKKKKDSKELKRLRGMWDEIFEKEGRIARNSVDVDLGDEEDDEDENPLPNPPRKKRRRVTKAKGKGKTGEETNEPATRSRKKAKPTGPSETTPREFHVNTATSPAGTVSQGPRAEIPGYISNNVAMPSTSSVGQIGQQQVHEHPNQAQSWPESRIRHAGRATDQPPQPSRVTEYPLAIAAEQAQGVSYAPIPAGPLQDHISTSPDPVQPHGEHARDFQPYATNFEGETSLGGDFETAQTEAESSPYSTALESTGDADENFVQQVLSTLDRTPDTPALESNDNGTFKDREWASWLSWE